MTKIGAQELVIATQENANSFLDGFPIDLEGALLALKIQNFILSKGVIILIFSFGV